MRPRVLAMDKRVRPWVLVFLRGCGLLTIVSVIAVCEASQLARVRIQQTTGRVGEVIPIVIHFTQRRDRPVTDLVLKLSFDASKLRYETFDLGNASVHHPKLECVASVSDNHDLLTLLISANDPGVTPLPSGELLIVTFRGRSPGVSPIELLSNSSASDAIGKPTPLTFASSRIRIIGQP